MRFEVESKADQTVTDLPRSLRSGENSVPRINRTPALSAPSLPQPKQEKPTPSVNLPNAEQLRDGEWSFLLWVLVITFALVGLWMAWRAISKSHQGGAK
jgi:hypothetical protein